MDNKTQKVQNELSGVKSFPIALTISSIILVIFVALGAFAGYRCFTTDVSGYRDRSFVTIYGLIFLAFAIWNAVVLVKGIVAWTKSPSKAFYSVMKNYALNALFAIGLCIYVVLDMARVSDEHYYRYYSYFMFNEMATYVIVGCFIGLIAGVFAQFERKSLRAVGIKNVYNVCALVASIIFVLIFPSTISNNTVILKMITGTTKFIAIYFVVHSLLRIAVPTAVPYKEYSDKEKELKVFSRIICAWEIVLAVLVVADIVLLIMSAGQSGSGSWLKLNSKIMSLAIKKGVLAIIFIGLTIFALATNSYLSEKERICRKKQREATSQVKTAVSVESVEEKGEGLASEDIRFANDISMSDACSELRAFIKAEGIDIGEVGAVKIFAGMASSRILLLKCKNQENEKSIAKALGEYFSAKAYVSAESAEWSDVYKFASGAEAQGEGNALYGMYYANMKPLSLNTVAITGAKAEVTNSYLTKIAETMKKETGSKLLQIGISSSIRDARYVYNGNILLPENLWIMVFVSGEENVFSPIVCDGATYICLDEVSCEKEEAQRRLLSLAKLEEITGNAREDYALPETWWRKIDLIEKYATKELGFSFDNVFVHTIEKYSAICGVREMVNADIVDAVLSGIIVPALSARATPEFADKDHGIYSEISRVIGMENLPCTKEALKCFGLAR